MDDNRGHNGVLFKEVARNGFSQCGWHSPDGCFYPCASFLHETVAEALAEKLYPRHAYPNHTSAMLAHGWVRAACDGYYEARWIEGGAKTVLLDLVSTLSPETKVVVDIIDPETSRTRTSIERYNASAFYERFI